MSERRTVTDGPRAHQTKPRKGDRVAVTEFGSAHRGNGKKRQKGIREDKNVAECPCVDSNGVDDKPSDSDASDVGTICRHLESLQKQRRRIQKQSNGLTNMTTAMVASDLGCYAALKKKERDKLWAKAKKMVKRIDAGEVEIDADYYNASDNGDEGDLDTEIGHVAGLVKVSQPSREGFANFEANLLEKMIELAAQLPVAPWFDHPDRRGIKLVMLATIVGEAGDLSNYPNPTKLWKRLFGAPYEKDGEVRMASTWKKMKKLSKDDHIEIKESPQRKAATYQLRENIVMQNFVTLKEVGEDGKKHSVRDENGKLVYEWCGPYRARYDETYAKAAEKHKDDPDWPPCHLAAHAKLLAAKRFVLELWREWNR